MAEHSYSSQVQPCMENRLLIGVQLLEVIDNESDIRRPHGGDFLFSFLSVTTLAPRAVRRHHSSVRKYDAWQVIDVINADHQIAMTRKILHLTGVSSNRNATSWRKHKEGESCSASHRSLIKDM